MRHHDGMAPPPRLGACAGRRSAAVLLSAVVLLSAGCAVDGPGDDAVWTVQPGHQVGPESTTFTAMVRRLGCNNGITGDVQESSVRVEEEAVVVTFYVEPNPRDASCPANDEIPVSVELPEPLGDRKLLDGQCSRDGQASGSAFCRDGGVRYSPAGTEP